MRRMPEKPHLDPRPRSAPVHAPGGNTPGMPFRHHLTNRIGDLAKQAQITNRGAFNVLNVLAGAMLMGAENELGEVALCWIRERTTREVDQ